MSVRIMAAVFEHSKALNLDRLVLLALADYAREEDGLAWPTIERLSLKVHMSKRAVQYALRRLEERGELDIIAEEGRPNTYCVRVDGGGANGAPLQIAPLHHVHGGGAKLASPPPPPPSLPLVSPLSPTPPISSSNSLFSTSTTPSQRTVREPSPEKDLPPRVRGVPPQGGPPSRVTRAKHGTQLPDDFTLTPERRQFAIDGGLHDASMVFGAFTDYSRATGRIFKDWDAAWRSWCRKERDIREARQQRGGR